MNKSRVYLGCGILLVAAGLVAFVLAFHAPVPHDVQMAMTVISMLAIGVGIGLLFGLFLKLIRRKPWTLETCNGQDIERRVRQKYVAIGTSLTAVGISFQALAYGVQGLAAQMVIRGAAILIMVAGIALNVTSIVKGREARGGKGD